MNNDTQHEPDGESEEPTPERGHPQKTPMFEAFNAARYHRQILIRAIQTRSRRKLICYVTGERAGISREDTLGFVDLLYDLAPDQPVDLLLHTHGGEIDAAEKLITMVQKLAGDAEIRAIVPDCAKSAGTLMTLGADVVVMSDTSELGPIDPQIALQDANGNLIPHSIQSHLDAYMHHSKVLEENPGNEVSRLMLNKLDPATITLFESVRARAQKLAEELLAQGMFRKNSGNTTMIAQALMNTRRWRSHGQMIDWQDARTLGLNVEYVAGQSPCWRELWQLYCLQRLEIDDGHRLFESDRVWLRMDGPQGSEGRRSSV